MRDKVRWDPARRPIIIHWDGASWSEVANNGYNRLNGVSGSGPTNVWAVGVSGAVMRWDGYSWSNMPSGTGQDLRAVAMSGGRAIVVGEGGTIRSWKL